MTANQILNQKSLVSKRGERPPLLTKQTTASDNDMRGFCALPDVFGNIEDRKHSTSLKSNSLTTSPGNIFLNTILTKIIFICNYIFCIFKA